MMNDDTFDFDDREDRRQFVADVLERFESAGEPFPFDGEKGAGPRESTWGRYTSSRLLSISEAIAMVSVAVAFVIIAELIIGLTAISLFILLVLAVGVPFIAYVSDVLIHRSYRNSAERSLERAKVTGEELEILHELYENFPDDYDAGAQIARRRASLRRIQRVPAYRGTER